MKSFHITLQTNNTFKNTKFKPKTVKNNHELKKTVLDFDEGNGAIFRNRLSISHPHFYIKFVFYNFNMHIY